MTIINSVIGGGGDKLPSLQSKTVTPSNASQTVYPDSDFDALDSVQVIGDTNLVSGNIKYGKNIFGVVGSYEKTTSTTYTLPVLEAQASYPSHMEMASGQTVYCFSDTPKTNGCKATRTLGDVSGAETWSSSGSVTTAGTEAKTSVSDNWGIVTPTKQSITFTGSTSLPDGSYYVTLDSYIVPGPTYYQFIGASSSTGIKQYWSTAAASWGKMTVSSGKATLTITPTGSLATLYFWDTIGVAQVPLCVAVRSVSK